MNKRIGIYAGTFDPIHSGHIAFALQALEANKLDQVYYMLERRPRDKPKAEHFAHRVAMLRRALKPHPKFQLLEMVESNFSVKQTMPKLKEQFSGDELIFLFGSDVIPNLEKWPNSKQLISNGEFIVGLRNNDDRDTIKAIVDNWKSRPKTITIIDSYAPHVSSGKVRSALRSNKKAHGLLSSVERYSGNNWLYVSLASVDIP
jgi:nicotinate-nucleotide adenylyltransferase